MRYDQIVPILEANRPKIAVEIGVHRGVRAALIAKFSEKYYGFDLWELGDAELDKAEYNGKGRSTREEAKRSLAGRDYELIQGNTLETLPEFAKRGILVDFAFVDGGHSIPTITSDWKHLKSIMAPGGVVVFDDFYTPESDRFGCNSAIRDEKYEILPHVDYTRDDGWECRLAVVTC